MTKISIIIATYNAAKSLYNCLESVVQQLSNPCELIIIDGGSTDNTIDIINSFKNKIAYLISEPDKGIYDAWNKGVKVANGKWLLFIGADDVLLPNALNSYLNILPEYKNYDFISARLNYLDDRNNVIAVVGKKWNYKRCRLNMDVTHVASLTNTNYFKRIGLFNTDYKICGDYELLLRGGKVMKAGFNPNIVANMKIGGVSFSIKGLKEQLYIKHKVGKVPLIFCYFIFLFQIFLFYTYRLRHR